MCHFISLKCKSQIEWFYFHVGAFRANRFQRCSFKAAARKSDKVASEEKLYKIELQITVHAEIKVMDNDTERGFG